MAEPVQTAQAGQCAPRAERFPGVIVLASDEWKEGAITEPAGQCAAEAVRFPGGRPMSDEPARVLDEPAPPKG